MPRICPEQNLSHQDIKRPRYRPQKALRKCGELTIESCSVRSTMSRICPTTCSVNRCSASISRRGKFVGKPTPELPCFKVYERNMVSNGRSLPCPCGCAPLQVFPRHGVFNINVTCPSIEATFRSRHNPCNDNETDWPTSLPCIAARRRNSAAMSFAAYTPTEMEHAVKTLAESLRSVPRAFPNTRKTFSKNWSGGWT